MQNAIVQYDDLARIKAYRHHDPGAILGRHTAGSTVFARSLLPHAVTARITGPDAPMTRVPDSDVFEYRGRPENVPEYYGIVWRDQQGREHFHHEPYCFPPQVTDFDLHLFNEGRHYQCYEFLGAHVRTIAAVTGVLFVTWAPNAERVSVIGDFNRWDGRCHPMRIRGSSGIWELFIPGLAAEMKYKFELRGRDGGDIMVKTDPYGRSFELRPATAGIVTGPSAYAWGDAEWLDARAGWNCLHAPLSIYELHAGSWRRDVDGNFLNFRALAAQLVPYVRHLGFTHIELMPISEHPLDASWGYQTTGFYAVSSRYGTPDDFRYFIDQCHRHGIGVILDWVAGHFPRDTHALARYDGTPLYEHADPRRGEHKDWGTLIFNYSRNEIRSFLIANARFWIREFHLDGLRVDAVASMLYLDYSRKPGEWLPNAHGGNENLEAIEFLRTMNEQVLGNHPGVLTIAEESTAWPQVTRPPWLGGLGFSMKWNMGWMHDTLLYVSKDPIYRHYHHDNLTFGLLYAFHENFVLPFSHDEVVHGKGSLINKMPGDAWQRFANLRLLYTYMYTYPGKKLLFMGAEFGQWKEWNHDTGLDWELTGQAAHARLGDLVRELNRLYTGRPELHYRDFESDGFEWIDCHDSPQSVLSYVRRHGLGFLIVVLNFTPVPRHGYRLGVPRHGHYRELLNSDSEYFGGSNLGNANGVTAEAHAWMGKPYSIRLDLPPLAGLILECRP
jgi:1,4-alpha-glucan branching enzyme